MVNAELYVRDLPGQLVGSLEPISMVDGNIVGVVHDREQMVNQRICINVTFKVNGSEDLQNLRKIWKSKDVIIAKMGSVYNTYSMEYLLMGNLNATYVDNLLKISSKTVSMESVSISYSSREGSNDRTVMITVEVRTKDDLDKLDSFFSERCEKDSLTYIRGL